MGPRPARLQQRDRKAAIRKREGDAPIAHRTRALVSDPAASSDVTGDAPPTLKSFLRHRPEFEESDGAYGAS